MENTNSKYITVSFIVAGLLLGIVVSVLLETLSTVSTGAFGRIVSQDVIRRGLPFAVGVGSFLVFQFSKPITTWADEVVTELRRVVWPSRKDTTAMTIMVCVMLLISGVYFGILDVVSGQVVDWLLHQNFFGLFS